MSYAINMDGFEGQKIGVNYSFWTGAKLLVNGQPAPKGKKRGEMILQRDDGTPVTIKWKPQVLGLDVPQLEAEGKTIRLVEPLKWYQLVWGGWPILMIFFGGALGAIAGFIGFLINTKIFRTQMSGILKYVLAGLVSVLSVVAYFVLAILFTILTQS